MLNTDRGADNYMIKYCIGDHGSSLIDVAPTRSNRLEMPLMKELRRSEPPPNTPRMEASSSYSTQYTGPSNGSGTSTPSGDYTRRPHIHIAAIDNSLSFPHEHPQGWRSYTYGWLYLPVSIIGRPFSERTRQHFLPLLTSKTWWEETTYQLQKLFAVDSDFHPQMFSVSSCHCERIYAQPKSSVNLRLSRVNAASAYLSFFFLTNAQGQAWNIVQSLRHTVSTNPPQGRRSQTAIGRRPFGVDSEDETHDMG